MGIVAEVKKVVIEEFDDEGNLVKRTTTEYDTGGRATGGEYTSPTYPGLRVGDVWPSGTGQWVTAEPNKYVSWNGPYDHGTFHSHRPGGTDRKGDGTVIE